MEEAIQSLWKKYKESDDKSAKDELIILYVDMVKIIAARLYTQYNRNVEFDDLLSYGIIGLIDAIEKFDLSKNIKFETYANLRIKGAIIDELRNLDWIPRSMRRKYSEIESAVSKLQSEYGGNYTNEQLANELNISEDELSKLMGEVSTFAMTSLEEKFEDQVNFDISSEDTDSSPEKSFEKKEMKRILKETIDILPEKEKLVISLYYYDELTYKEIGNVLNVSESRVSQLHTKAISTLNSSLKRII